MKGTYATRLALAAALVASCSSYVSRGYPPLVNGCQSTADCAAAGAQYVCDAGACQILACDCDGECPAALACYLAPGDAKGECLVIQRTSPCDAGIRDGG